MSDHKRSERWVLFSLFAAAICSSMLVAGAAFAGASGPVFRPPFDFNQSGSSDVLLMKTSGSPNVGINQTNIVSGITFVAPRGWPDLNTSGAGVEYETLSAGVFDGNGFEQAQILTRKNVGSNLGLIRIVKLQTNGIIRFDMPATSGTAQFFVGGSDTDWSFLGVGDCDANGADDIVLYNTSGGASDGTIRIIFMNLSTFTVLATQTPGVLSASNTPIGVGDADGDGQADIWTLDTGTQGIEVLINSPTVASGGVFESAQMPTSLPTSYVVSGIGLFNSADARADILFEKTANPNQGVVKITYTGTGGGSAGAPAPEFPVLLNVAIGETMATVGDYDGANQTDLLTRLLTPTNPANNGALRVRLMNAAGTDLAGMAGSPSNWSNPLTFTVIDGSPQ